MPVFRTPCSAVEASKHIALSWAREPTPSCCEVEETRALGGLATEHHALHPERASSQQPSSSIQVVALLYKDDASKYISTIEFL